MDIFAFSSPLMLPLPMTVTLMTMDSTSTANHLSLNHQTSVLTTSLPESPLHPEHPDAFLLPTITVLKLITLEQVASVKPLTSLSETPQEQPTSSHPVRNPLIPQPRLIPLLSSSATTTPTTPSSTTSKVMIPPRSLAYRPVLPTPRLRPRNCLRAPPVRKP